MWSNNFYNFANYFNIFFCYNILSSFVVISDKSSIFVATKQSKRII